MEEGIVLGHRASLKELEVQRTKIEFMEKLQPHANVKGIKSFLGYVKLYRGFKKDFSKISFMHSFGKRIDILD